MIFFQEFKVFRLKGVGVFEAKETSGLGFDALEGVFHYISHWFWGFKIIGFEGLMIIWFRKLKIFRSMRLIIASLNVSWVFGFRRSGVFRFKRSGVFRFRSL